MEIYSEMRTERKQIWKLENKIAFLQESRKANRMEWLKGNSLQRKQTVFVEWMKTKKQESKQAVFAER